MTHYQLEAGSLAELNRSHREWETVVCARRSASVRGRHHGPAGPRHAGIRRVRLHQLLSAVAHALHVHHLRVSERSALLIARLIVYRR